MRFAFTHTHVYPGGHAHLSGADVTARSDAPCVVEFSDGIVLPATCSLVADAVLLRLPAYRTTRGTQIEPNGWMLKPGTKRDEWIVVQRLASAGRS